MTVHAVLFFLKVKMLFFHNLSTAVKVMQEVN